MNNGCPGHEYGPREVHHDGDVIILNVPFFADERESSCQGIACMKMVVKFFFPDSEINENMILEKMNYKKGHWLYATHIMMGLDKFKIRAKYLSNSKILKVAGNVQNLKILTGKEPSEISLENEFDIKLYDDSVDYVLSRGLFEEKNVSIADLKELLRMGNMLIVVIDRNALKKTRDTYKGHYTLLVGFDEKGFLLNEPFIKENLHVSYEIFDKAFNSTENFKDVVIINIKRSTVL